jgi:hypothetical protein
LGMMISEFDDAMGMADIFTLQDPVEWIEKYFFVPELNGPMVLGEYQRRAIHEAMKTDDDGLMLYTLIVWSDIKKSIKSCIAAAMGLWVAFTRPWASVKVIANDLKQADSRVFFYMRRAIELNPELSMQATIRMYNIYITKQHSKIEAIPIDPKGEAGGNDTAVIYSEAWGFKGDIAQRMWCYDQETDILSGRGWIKGVDLNSDDLVAAFDPEADTIVWEKPREIFKEHYSGEMHLYENSSFSECVTPEHRLYGIFSYNERKDEDRIMRSSELRNSGYRVYYSKTISVVDGSAHVTGEYTAVNKDTDWKTINYDGEVWCPSVSTGLVVVRRHGKVCVSGNTESTLSSTQFGKSFRWVETYAGFSGESEILENLYLSGVKDAHQVDWAGEFEPALEAYVNNATGQFTLWNSTPRLPWQSEAYYCLPLPTNPQDLMALTKNGWKEASNITTDDYICTRNSDGAIEYQKPLNIFKREYSGELIRFKCQKANFLMTPNHRIFAAYASHTRKVHEIKSKPFVYEYKEAKEAGRIKIGWIPGHGVWDHDPIESVSIENKIYNGNDFVELLAWYLSEGVVQIDKRNTRFYYNAVCIYQDKEKNLENYEKIEYLCQRMGFRFSPKRYKGKITGIRIFDSRLARYLLKFGKSKDKYIPRFILEDCSLEQLKLFLFAYIDGDGTKAGNGWRIYTNSDQMRLDLMELVFKCGLRPTYNGSYSSAPNRKGIHHIYVSPNHIGWYSGSKKRNRWKTEIACANTEVWCPTLPNGNFYIMQNGACCWTGNSQEAAALTPMEFDRVHRNQWASSENAFVPIEWWYACQTNDTPELKHEQPIIVSVDAAVTNDLFAIVAVSGRDSDDRDVDIRYTRVWKPPRGGRIDYAEPEAELRRLCAEYNVIEVCYDMYQLADMAGRFRSEMIARMYSFNQTNMRLIADKRLYDMIRDRKVHHRGEPELAEHIENANAKSDGHNKMRIIKSSQVLKIDLAVCTSMAVHRACHWRL